jgi:hypothetical protein
MDDGLDCIHSVDYHGQEQVLYWINVGNTGPKGRITRQVETGYAEIPPERGGTLWYASSALILPAGF